MLSKVPQRSEVIPVPNYFCAQYHLQEIIEYVEAFDEQGRPRDLMMVDFFAGCCQAYTTFKENGQSAAFYDFLIGGELHNILFRKGFMFGLELICRLKMWGLLLGGVPCSFYIFMSSSIHKRTPDDPAGDVLPSMH